MYVYGVLVTDGKLLSPSAGPYPRAMARGLTLNHERAPLAQQVRPARQAGLRMIQIFFICLADHYYYCFREEEAAYM